MSLVHDLRRAWRRFRARPAAERALLVRSLLRSIRAGGPRAALARLRAVSGPADEQERYLRWCALNTPDHAELARMREASSRFDYQPLVSILTPVYNTDPRWLEACADSVMAQAYARWEWEVIDDGSTKAGTVAALERIAARDRRIHVQRAPANGGISAASNLALAAAAGDYVALLDHDDALAPHALFRMIDALNRVSPRPDLLYSDEDKLDLDGQRCDAYFKPDWSPDLFLSSMYVCHFLMARRALVVQAGGFRSAYDFAQDYDLVLRLMDLAPHVAHVADVLYHWRKIPQSAALAGAAKPTAHLAAQRAIADYLQRNHVAARVEDAGPIGLHRVRYADTGEQTVTIVVLSEGEGSPHLVRLLQSIDCATSHRPIELIVVSGDGRAPSGARSLLDKLGARMAAPARAGSSPSIDAALTAAHGAHVLFADEAIEPRDATWLGAIVELSAQPGIGAVGAKLYDSRGALQHVGLVLGLTGVAGRPFRDHHADTAGYFSGANSIRNYSAVSGACLMTRREVFDRVGGMDAALAMEGAAIDYCLKVRDAGLRIVFTPYARLTHHDPVRLELSPQDEKRLRERWGSRLAADPYYNPHLTREFLDYRVNV